MKEWLFATRCLVISAGLVAGPAAGEQLQPLAATDQRLRDPATYFQSEHEQINARRAREGLPTAPGRPLQLTGLALSGGGIRASAFHLGILSGLSRSVDGKAAPLATIDYLSAVSGGSWAAAGVWAWPGPSAELFDCLDTLAEHGLDSPTGGGCLNAAPMLRTEQLFRKLSAPKHQRKEAWRQGIEAAYFRAGCNPAFSSEPEPPCADPLAQNPYLVINATHRSGGRNFPFEFTPDHLALLGGKDSRLPGEVESPGGSEAGFWYATRGDAVRWTTSRLNSNKAEDGTKLSLAVANSSAIVGGAGPLAGPGIGWVFAFEPRPGWARRRYTLDDGGHTENLGLLPLVERGVDVIVSAEIGKEERPFEDLDEARRQIAKLLGCELGVPARSPGSARVQEIDYVCPRAPGPERKRVIVLRPSVDNIEDFERFMRDAAARTPALNAVVDYLDSEGTRGIRAQDRFPQTRTLQERYDENLIRAYYLLGRFLAATELRPLLARP